MNPANGSSPSGGMSAPSLQPQGGTPDIAPAGLPGASPPQISTAPNVQKPQTGDPTVQLFTAINNADYNSAQDAISRGADMNAQNSLGETPLDLSIALNRNNITFMLLSARNEGGGGDDSTTTTPVVAQTAPAAKSTHAGPARQVSVPRPAHNAIPVNDPGTPNTAAGFLGFGPKN
jgi:hypothetical protein